MVVEALRGVSLGVPDAGALVSVPTPKPPPGTAFPPRRLTLRGTPVFELANWCGTCPALFQRLSDGVDADLEIVTERLNAGLDTIDRGVLDVYGRVLPRSRYTVLLQDLTPQLVRPGDPSDYFAHEQVATWGIDPAVGRPESPATDYYRTFEAPVAGRGHLYEFAVPMVPPAWNVRERVDEYRRDAGVEVATAVAYSLLDIVQPAMDKGVDYYEHWVLTHFLLDGHHKFEAASIDQRPVRLLSFLDERIGIASDEDVDVALVKRSGVRSARR